MENAKYFELFRQESAEHLAVLESFVASGAPADAGSLQGPFRSAHSIKGMAAAMGFDAIQTLCHALEEGFAKVRSGAGTVSGEMHEAWFSAVALLREQLNDADASTNAPEALLATLRGGPAAPQPAAEGTAAPARVPPPANGAARGASGRFALVLHISPTSPLPAARALTAVKRLETLGTLHELQPTLAQIAAGEFHNVLRCQIDAGEAQIREKLAGLSDLSAIDLQPVSAHAAPAQSAGAAHASAVRVDGARLDELTLSLERLLGLDAVLNARFGSLPESADLLRSNRKYVLALANTLAAIRLVPFSAIADRLRIAFRDVVGKLGKQAQLRISGEETVLDRRVLDELADPLLHLLRNSLDHGLESPAERAALGKPAEGEIQLSIRKRADRAIVTVGDDGRGMNAENLRRAAVRKGYLAEDRARALTDAQAYELITLPGFSTAEKVSEISGRGVGMDVVRYKIESLGGRLKIETEPGRGTRFILSLPITTLQQTVMLFEWEGSPFGLPLGSLIRAGIAESWEMAKAGGDWQLLEEGRPLPLLSLSMLYGGSPILPAAQQPYLRLDHEGQALALAASRVIGTAELLIKSLPAPINLLPGLSGAAILGDGRVAIMLDPEFVAQGAR